MHLQEMSKNVRGCVRILSVRIHDIARLVEKNPGGLTWSIAVHNRSLLGNAALPVQLRLAHKSYHSRRSSKMQAHYRIYGETTIRILRLSKNAAAK